jgi:hypothetical protein
MAMRTGRLFHITPTESGTLPSCFLAKRFTIAPKTPVIGVGGTRTLLMVSSCWSGVTVAHETPAGTRL